MMQRLAEKTSVRRGWRAVTARIRFSKREVGNIDERDIQREILGAVSLRRWQKPAHAGARGNFSGCR
ncbi:MAG: hypothetical protein ACRYGL_19585 [Janthinobacterium lividum]